MHRGGRLQYKASRATFWITDDIPFVYAGSVVHPEAYSPSW